MSGLWFVTPAWQRYEMTAVCLEQRRRVIAELAARGIEAHQVVVADDENLDIARAAGAAVVESPNFDASGRARVGGKFNDGNAFAGLEGGADWIVQIGSDSWIATDYFDPLVDPAVTLTSPAYAAVRLRTMAVCSVSPRFLDHSAGPYVFHRSLLEPSGFRPAEDDSNMTDTSTIAGIVATTGRPIRWRVRTVHPLQYVGFRVPPMMTSYRSLRRRWLVAERDDPFRRLARVFPPDLVERARRAMIQLELAEAHP